MPVHLLPLSDADALSCDQVARPHGAGELCTEHERARRLCLVHSLGLSFSTCISL